MAGARAADRRPDPASRAEARISHVEGNSPWLTALSLAYARAAAAACDLYAELARRANRLLAAGPKLRGKDADRMLAILLVEDAQPATAGREASDRSTRRLFERLVSLGAARELTGRPSGSTGFRPWDGGRGSRNGSIPTSRNCPTSCAGANGWAGSRP
jgi:hypothetical protein